MSKKILVPLAQGCEELEAVTLIDLLRRAGLYVITASLDDNIIVCSRGTRLLADTTIDNIVDDKFDMVVLPGGLPGADNLNGDARIHQILTRTCENNNYIAAICAAPKVLMKNGLLDGKRFTCYPGAVEIIEASEAIQTADAITFDGKVITSRGPGTAMDFALKLIEILTDKETSLKVESALQRPQ